MLEFQGRRKSKKKLYGLVTLVILLILIVVLIRPTWKIWRKNVRSSEELKEAEIRIQELKDRQKSLSADLQNLDNIEGQEEAIVKKFNVVKEGQKLAVILESEEKEEQQEDNVGFFERVFGKFFGWLKD